MVQEVGYKDVVNSVQNGIGFAMQARQLSLQEKELEMKQASLKSTRDESLLAQMDKLAEVSMKSQKLDPKVKSAMVKYATENFSALGMEMGPVFQAWMQTDEGGAETLAFVQALRESAARGDLNGAAEKAEAFRKTVSSDQFFQVMRDTIADNAKERQAEIANSGRLAMQDKTIEAQKNLQDDKQTFEAGENLKDRTLQLQKIRLEKINEFRNDAGEIIKEYDRIDKSFKNVNALMKSDPQIKNPQTGKALVRLYLGTIEAAPSVVRSEEEKMIRSGGADIITRAKEFAQTYTEGQDVPPRVARDIFEITKRLYPEHVKSLKSRLSPIQEGIKGNKLEGAAKEILGDKAGLFGYGTKAAGAGKPAAKASATQSPALRSAINNYRKNVGRAPNDKEIAELKKMIGE